MLAALNPQIVAELEALANGWIVFVGEPTPASLPKPGRVRQRRRNKTPKP
jgi:hypothetical protein